MIISTLKSFEEYLGRNFPKVLQSFNEPATSDLLAQFNATCFNSNGVPEELVELYSWHNGQSQGHSFNQDDGFRLLPVDDVMASYQFLRSPNEELIAPYSSKWIPLLYNGSGDYIVYVHEAPLDSQLLYYWHDQPEHPTAYQGLENLIQSALRVAQDSNEQQQELQDHAWCKVKVVMLRSPQAGAKSLKVLKDKLKHELGYGEIRSAIKEGPVVLINDKYYVHVKDQVAAINSQFGQEVLAIYQTEEPFAKIGV